MQGVICDISFQTHLLNFCRRQYLDTPNTVHKLPEAYNQNSSVVSDSKAYLSWYRRKIIEHLTNDSTVNSRNVEHFHAQTLYKRWRINLDRNLYKLLFCQLILLDTNSGINEYRSHEFCTGTEVLV